MNGDYLYDKEGEPDPEIARLEHLLARHRHRPRPLVELDARRTRWFRPALVAAAFALVSGAIWLATRGSKEPASKSSHVAYAVEGADEKRVLTRATPLETGSAERLSVAIGGIGRVLVAPNTRLLVEERSDADHSLFLERGSLQARIFAAPRAFQIGTPAGRSIDLGCEYALEVDDAGASTLRVMTGQVAFEFDGREVYVPAGATCTSVPGRGPSAPAFEHGSEAFVSALRAIEFDLDPDPRAVQSLLDAAEREDTLSLWHLFDSTKTARRLRDAAFDGLGRVFPLPAGVTAESIRSGDGEARRRWRDTMKPAWRSTR